MPRRYLHERRIVTGLIAAIVAGLAWLATLSPLGAEEMSVRTPIEGTGIVYRVIDGDTFIVNMDDRALYERLRAAAREPVQARHLNDRFASFRIRLFGIDTPESVHPDEARNTAEGRAISQAVRDVLEGERVGFRCWTFGLYGRAICSVSLGGADVGEWLIANGASPYDTRFGRHPFDDVRYRAAERSVSR
ncbi:endonuclease YncB(thermonuclease family) [Natronocella acetinitrilica]|uniref:Endonuclease YncB(Thermonuclease family) n=1 Tax=Natronocella acetinitrilica TaxID=414046 RepID=A0AAE3G2Y2_9GAMM|nr:thermonuclease family protein [Natronocella acetinitrilica]MCP1674462.1 endonuclease YncB(thermonuclease family) [Natronocella acetinitrilica]